MTDRPILFSAPMIRALLDGRKTQTRRVLSRNNTTVLGDSWRGKSCPWEGLRFAEAVVRTKSPMAGQHDPHLAVPFCHPADEPTASEDCGIYAVRPVIEIGDRLWVRENLWLYGRWRQEGTTPKGRPRQTFDLIGKVAAFEKPADIAYWGGKEGFTFRPGIHMPRWASRLTLTVTDVRVQRLQEISETDAAAEGAERLVMDDEGRFYQRDNGTHRCGFAGLWAHINGADSWDANPWIVALTFTVERRNIDELK